MGILTPGGTFPFEFLFLAAHLGFTSFCPSAALDCEADCQHDYSNPDFKPQECAQQCPNGGTSGEAKNDAMEGVLEEVNSLRVMVIILLFLVLLLLVLFVLTLARGTKWRRWLTKFNRKVKKTGDAEKGKQEAPTVNKEGVTIANYACSYSSSPTHECPQRTSSVKAESGIPPSAKGGMTPEGEATKQKARRLPSESACPAEAQVEVNGYDNLGLSTSTINFHSRPSSPSATSSADTTAVSIATLETTMTTVNLQDYSGACSPSASDVGRRAEGT